MKGVLRTSLKMAVATALLLAATGAAQAQSWPTTNTLRCNWTLSSGGVVTQGGNSTIKFSYTSFSPSTQSWSGNLTTWYPNGSVVVKPFNIYWDWITGQYDRFIYHQTQDNITCSLTRTFDNGGIVVFDGCTPNGAFQYCRP